MYRLPFRLPEWAPRINWVSEDARAVWEPRIQRISNAWIQAERDLVAAGVRPSALQHVSLEQLPILMQEEAVRGLMVLPLAQVAKASGYQSASVGLQQGAPFDYRCAITKAEHAADWAKAWSRSDNEAIGKLLGYPECCRNFFEQVWVKEHWMDTTLPMSDGATNLDIGAARYCNMLWRWLGVRLVSHLPCYIKCKETSILGEQSLRVFETTDPEAAKWIWEILSWPVQWSSLHGIAEITSPIHRMSVPTDALAQKAVVQLLGSAYPAEGASGDSFPRKAVKPLMRMSNSKDNGFATHVAMQEAHDKLLSLLNPPYGTVLDLGCGDGVLLSKIPAKRRVGVEHDARVAKLAEKRLDQVIVDDVTNHEFVKQVISSEKPDLVIAQRDRNPYYTLEAPLILSYTYERETEAQLFRNS